MNKNYAGIGSRKLTRTDLDLCYRAGKWLAQQGWVLNTGACPGADQSFAEGALDGGGQVVLFVPWPNYQFPWVQQAVGRGAKKKLLQPYHKEAYASVNLYHPKPKVITETIRKLHARNYLIVKNCRFVMAFPQPTILGGLGGTGQGIRIATSLGIELLRLDVSFDRRRVEARLKD